MNILKIFQKSKKESIEWLEFFYCLAEVENYLKVKYGKSNNILIINFIKLLEWCSSFLASQVNDYAKSLTDYVFWKSRQFYLESMRKFVAGKSNASEFVDQVLYSILSNKREGQSLEEDFQSQLTLELDSKSFKFSKIILNLILPLEAFDDEPEEGDENYFTEEILREGVKLALIDMEKYFKN
jgi:Fe-S-cluster formation regulator IscX/YfhJ